MIIPVHSNRAGISRFEESEHSESSQGGQGLSKTYNDGRLLMMRFVRRCKRCIHSALVNGTYLITWVPAELLELATAGIEGNPEMGMRWAEEEDTEVIRRQRRCWSAALNMFGPVIARML